MDENQLLHLVRKRQKDIELFVCLNLLPKYRSISQTGHFKEWFKLPMNYVRLIELPLTFELLDIKKNHVILDISSPKLLALYMVAKSHANLCISDIEDYFVKDFEAYSEAFKVSPIIQVFDARSIPYNEHTFDRIFSVSVLEHIPDTGDIDVVREVARVLKPGGVFVFTLPAYSTYLEEWQKQSTAYWPTTTREDGFVFFQRRYDYDTIIRRFNYLGFNIEDIVFIAEKPVKQPVLNENGMLMHNYYFLDERWYVKRLYRINKIPLLPYLAARIHSKHYHYLTRDGKDRNIRQVAVKLRANS